MKVLLINGSPHANGCTYTALENVAIGLHEKGIETEPIRIDELTNKKMTFFKDPDGLPLELHE